MDSLLSALPYIQMVLAVMLIGAILMQQRGAGLGGAFGGSNDGTVHYERRGFEKTLFKATIALAVVFILSAALPIFLTPTSVSTAPTQQATTSNNTEVDVESDNTPTTNIDSSMIELETTPTDEAASEDVE